MDYLYRTAYCAAARCRQYSSFRVFRARLHPTLECPHPIIKMQLKQAIRLSDTACLALTGSGGKTTALFQLARSLGAGPGSSQQATARRPVIVTATTHLHIDQVSLADSHWIWDKSCRPG